MKNIYTPALAALLLSTSFATADVAAPTGFYVGIQQGYNMMKSKYNNANFDTNDTQFARAKKSTSGILGEVLGGGRMTFGSGWTTGLELAFGSDTNSTKVRLIHPNAIGAQLVENRVKRQYFFTPAITLGRNLCANWHAFVKFGMPISRYKVRYNNLSSAGSEVFRKTSTKIGFAPALGAEYVLNKRFSVQGSVGMEWHKKISHTIIPFDTAIPLTSYKGKINELNGNIKIGLLYKL